MLISKKMCMQNGAWCSLANPQLARHLAEHKWHPIVGHSLGAQDLLRDLRRLGSGACSQRRDTLPQEIVAFSAMPWEAAAPFGIIVAAITATGSMLYGLNYLEYGKPKPTTQDDFDRALILRDQALTAKKVR